MRAGSRGSSPPSAPPAARPHGPTAGPRCARALHAAPPLARVEIAVEGEGEFVLLIARREAGGLAIVAPVADPKLVDQAIRKTAAGSA